MNFRSENWQEALRYGFAFLFITACVSLLFFMREYGATQHNDSLVLKTHLPLRMVLPDYENVPVEDALYIKDRWVFPALRSKGGSGKSRAHNSEFTGVAFEVTGLGYGGRVDLLMGINPEGKLTGAHMTHKDFSATFEDALNYPRDFFDHLRGLSVKDLHLKSDGGKVDSLGLSVATANSILGRLREGMNFYGEHRHQILIRLARALLQEHDLQEATK